MTTEVHTPWEGYNSYDDVSNDSRGHMIKDATLVQDKAPLPISYCTTDFITK